MSVLEGDDEPDGFAEVVVELVLEMELTVLAAARDNAAIRDDAIAVAHAWSGEDLALSIQDYLAEGRDAWVTDIAALFVVALAYVTHVNEMGLNESIGETVDT